MWSHSIIKIDSKDSIGLRVDVEFSEGDRSTIVTYYPTELNQLKQKIQGELNKRNSSDALEPLIELGPISLDIVVPDPDRLPDIEKEQIAYSEDIRTCRRFKEAISLGILGEDNEEYRAVLDRLQRNYKEEYLPILWP